MAITGFNFEPVEDPEYVNQFDFSGGVLKPVAERTPTEVLKHFEDFDQVNTMLWNSMQNGKPPAGVTVESVHGTVQGVFDTINTVDKFGKAIMQGSPCKICQKQVKWMPSNGYCSVECFLKDLLNRLAIHRAKQAPWQKYVDIINDTLNFLNLVLNMLTELP